MAIYTPRGLKIRLTVPYTFGLMARLYPTVTPFRVLKTTEGIESLSRVFPFIAGLVAFGLHLSPTQIALVVGISQLAGTLISSLGFKIAFVSYTIPCLVGLGTLYSYISGCGIYLFVIILTGFVLGGWQAVMAFFVGKIIASIIGQKIELWQMKFYHKLTGHAFTSSEVNFFNAYRLHASQIGVTTDIVLSDTEMEEDHWGTTFHQFAMKWPEVVQRFTID